MTDSKNIYQKAIEANIAVHSAMADKYNTAEPHFREESVDRVNNIVKNISNKIEIKSVLDLGCGTGFMINILKGYADSIIGVDVTQAMLDKVDKSGNANIELINADTGSVELPENHFDLATAYTFLDHLYEMLPTFANCYRSLRDGGLFYADLSPNAYFWDDIRELNVHTSYDSIVNREVLAVHKKNEEIEAEFGVDKDLFTLAEYQKHVVGGLREELVEKQLQQVGFKNITFIYHWFIGQAQLINDTSMSKEKRFDHASVMHEYLTKSLPVSRNLFKYIGFIAEK